MEDQPIQLNEDEIKAQKLKDRNEYMNDYIKKKYKANPVFYRMYKNSLNIKKKYNIPIETQNKYKHALHNIIKIKEMIEELDEGVFETFLMEYKSMEFEKK